MRNILRLAMQGNPAAEKEPAAQGLAQENGPETGVCRTDNPAKTPAAAPEMACASPLEQGVSAAAAPNFPLQALENNSKTLRQPLTCTEIVGVKPPISGGFPAPAKCDYLSGFRQITGDVSLIRHRFFTNPYQWAERKVAELAERGAKARAFFDSTIPTWDAPIPTADELARMRRLTCKALAQAWEYRLLKAHLDEGWPAPASGYKGLRVYHLATPRQSELLLQDVARQVADGAPGIWHGPNIVQLAEADYVVVVA